MQLLEQDWPYRPTSLSPSISKILREEHKQTSSFSNKTFNWSKPKRFDELLLIGYCWRATVDGPLLTDHWWQATVDEPLLTGYCWRVAVDGSLLTSHWWQATVEETLLTGYCWQATVDESDSDWSQEIFGTFDHSNLLDKFPSIGLSNEKILHFWSYLCKYCLVIMITMVMVWWW